MVQSGLCEWIGFFLVYVYKNKGQANVTGPRSRLWIRGRASVFAVSRRMSCSSVSCDVEITWSA